MLLEKPLPIQVLNQILDSSDSYRSERLNVRDDARIRLNGSSDVLRETLSPEFEALFAGAQTDFDIRPDQPAHDNLGAVFASVIHNYLDGLLLIECVPDDFGNPVSLVVQYANATFGRITGIDPAQIIGSPIQDDTLRNVKIKLYSWCLSTIRSGDPLDREILFAHKNGVTGVRITIVPIVNGCAVTLSVLKESRDAEEYQRRLKTLTETTSDAIIGTTIEGTITYWNPAAERLFKRREEDMLGTPVCEIVSAEKRDEFEAILREVTRDRRVRRFETVRQRKDGAFEDMAVSVFATLDTEGKTNGLFIVAKDVMLHRRYFQAVLRAKRKAEKANRLKSAWLANMSHEFRTPLTTILGFAEVLQETIDGENREYVDLIYSSAERLMYTLSSVLELSQLESGDREFTFEHLDLCAVIDLASSTFAEAARKRGLEFEIGHASDDLIVNSDRVAVEQILRHLLSNAVKFTREGSISIRTRKEGERVIVEIADTGVGIGDDCQPHIFDTFFQESNGDNREFEGAGLGLPIVRHLIKGIGGSISVQSRRDVGTTVSIGIPLATGLPVRRPATGIQPAVVSRSYTFPPESSHPSDTPGVTAPESVPAGSDQAEGASGVEPEYSESIPENRNGSSISREESIRIAQAKCDSYVARVNEEARQKETDAVSKPTPAPASTHLTHQRRPRILIVEDNERTQRLFSIMLEDQYDVEIASGVDSAIEKAREELFDAVVLDINLGERRTGVEVMHALWEIRDYLRVPMVACTAYALPGDETRFLQAGFHGYVGKPLKKQALVDTLEQVLKMDISAAKWPPEKAKLDLELPPVPGTLPVVVSLLSNKSEYPNVDLLIDTLKRDPVTTALVLRSTNSAYYSIRQKASTIERAVTLLGFEPVCNLVLLSALKRTFSKVQRGETKSVYEHLMKTSIATGAFGRLLSSTYRVASPETVFTAGLLHQLGALALLSSKPQAYTRLWISDDSESDFLEEPPIGQEIIHFGVDHIQVGIQIAHEWDLPAELATPMRYYNAPHHLNNQEFYPITLLTGVGHAASQWYLTGCKGAHQRAQLVRALIPLATLCRAGVEDMITKIEEKTLVVNDLIELAFEA